MEGYGKVAEWSLYDHNARRWLRVADQVEFKWEYSNAAFAARLRRCEAEMFAHLMGDHVGVYKLGEL